MENPSNALSFDNGELNGEGALLMFLAYKGGAYKGGLIWGSKSRQTVKKNQLKAVIRSKKGKAAAAMVKHAFWQST